MGAVEDTKEELKELAKFLENGYFGSNLSDAQASLLIELTVMKLKELSGE